MPTSLADALAQGVVALDGGLSTELEAAGHDVSTSLWSARLVEQDPAAVVAAHTRFFAAGARVATTASYQVSAQGFAAAGLGGGAADRSLRRSVALARDARDQAGLTGSAWVAGSVGPYGAVLADGSEYTGAYAGHGRPRPGRAAPVPPAAVAGPRRRGRRRPRLRDAARRPGGRGAPARAGRRGRAGLGLADDRGRRGRDGAHPSRGAGGGRLRPAARRAVGGRGRRQLPRAGRRLRRRRSRRLRAACRWSSTPTAASAGTRRTARGPATRGWRRRTCRRGWTAGARLVGGCCRVGPELLADLVRRLPAGPATPG